MLQENNEALDELIGVYASVHDLHDRLYGTLSKVSAELKAGSLSNEELCDIGFLCRETSKLLDESRKETNARQEFSGRLMAFNIVKESVCDPDADPTVRGSLASAVSDCKMQARLPKHGTPEYDAMFDQIVTSAIMKQLAEVVESNCDTAMNLIGKLLGKILAPEMIIEITQIVNDNCAYKMRLAVLQVVKETMNTMKEENVFKLDWNGVTEYCTSRMQEGKPLPSGITETYPKYVTTYRKKG